MGCHFFLQGIFLTQELKLHLLLWQVDSLLCFSSTQHRRALQFIFDKIGQWLETAMLLSPRFCWWPHEAISQLMLLGVSQAVAVQWMESSWRLQEDLGRLGTAPLQAASGFIFSMWPPPALSTASWDSQKPKSRADKSSDAWV